MRLPPPLALPGSGPEKALLRAPAEALANEHVIRAQGLELRWGSLIFPLLLLPLSPAFSASYVSVVVGLRKETGVGPALRM